MDRVKRLQQLMQEAERRAKDSVLLYEPLPMQERFLKSKASVRIVRGGNRSGKSLTSFLELARAARGLDPHKKYPERALLIYIVGYDLDTVGRVAHRLLFRPGAYRIIRDEVTNKWRAFRPWYKSDQDRYQESEPAPPMIPPECIDEKGWAWENKAERVFSVCRLLNGTEIRAFGSKSEPAMGDPVDIVMIDEDIHLETWATEMEARLSDRKGKMWWCAFPLLKNDAMVKLSQRAEAQADRENPDVAEFVLTYSDNPHIDPDEKRKRIEGWSSEERRARDLGQYVTDSVLMYPSFSREQHGLPRRGATEPDALEFLCPNGEIPDNWTRYMSVDPGHSVCAVLFGAVPPPEVGEYLVIYKELYLRGCSAEIFGREVANELRGRVCHAFIIDDHGSRVTQAGAGVTIRHQYSEQLELRSIASTYTHHGFFKGNDDPTGRAEMVRGWMCDRPGLGPRLRIVLDKCPSLVTEFSLFKKRILYGKHAGDKPIPVNNHACNALEYLVAYKPYYAPPPPVAAPNGVFERWKARFARKKSLNGGQMNLGPVSSHTRS
jgi:hypothetical protein